MKSKIYGYMRVSTKEQNEDRQLLELLKFGISKKNIFMDKQSGKDFERPDYQKLVHSILKNGDLMVIKSIDRLGRNYHEILQEWKFITGKIGADIFVIDMPLLDTRQRRDLIGTLISDIVLQLLSFVAENERENIRQRQAEGIQAARLRGVHLGRKKSPLPKEFNEIYRLWKIGKINYKQAADTLGKSKSTFFRLAKQYEQEVSPPGKQIISFDVVQQKQ